MLQTYTPRVTGPKLTASPTSAYRADVAIRGRPFGSSDDSWLAAAAELRAARGQKGAKAREHLYEALGVAIDTLGDENIDAFVRREWRGERCYVEALAALVALMEDEGAVHLTAVMLDDLLATAAELSHLERGRLLAMRARVEWKLGRLDDAEERYQFIASLARRDKTGELATRAELGFAALAQLRGNMPAVREHAERVIAIAGKHKLAFLGRMAYHGITMVEAKAGRFPEAARAAWTALELSRHDATAEAEALQVLGQTLLEGGQPALARASFAAVATRKVPARLILAALGGLAVASARESREPTVEWAVREVWRLRNSVGRTYQLSEALYECALALALLGRSDESGTFRSAALAIAREEGYNELVFRIEAMAAPEVRHAPAALTDPSLVQSIAQLEPERLPKHVELEAAPA